MHPISLAGKTPKEYFTKVYSFRHAAGPCRRRPDTLLAPPLTAPGPSFP
jgi:hypothetical protein